VAKAHDRCGQGKDPWDLAWPLYDEGVTKPMILDWWANQPFDLEIPDRLGNCTLCFLKARWKLAQNIEEDPSCVDWWIEEERAVGGHFRPPSRAYASYVDLKRWALSDAPKQWKQGDLLDALAIECTCTD